MPTDAELYEQVKRVLRAGDPELTKDGFVLACHDCGFAAPREAELGMLIQHMQLVHDRPMDDAESALELDLVWVGEGPPPVPSNG